MSDKKDQTPTPSSTQAPVDDVIQNYLDHLLVEATETPTKPSVVSNVALPETPVATPVDVPADVPSDVSSETASVTTSVADTEASSALNSHVESATSWKDDAEIECLLFELMGLRLAIPLAMLGGVHNNDGKVTPLFGQAQYSLGVWQGDEQKITILDTAQLVMPEKNRTLAEEGYEFFIQLDRSPWALACQSICTTITLTQDNIRWSGPSSKRQWLAGTVISEMCALVDVPATLKQLHGK